MTTLFIFADEDCKKKWKAIRDGYHRFKKKQKGCTWTSGPKNTKDKRHILLRFLDDIPQHRIEGSNLSLSLQLSDDEDSIRETEEEQQGFRVAIPTSSTDQTYPVVCEVVKARKKIISKQPNRQFMKLMRQRKEQRNTSFQTITKKKVDDVDLFCGHLAEVLRNLPPVEKAKAKQHLNNVLSKYEIMAAGNSSQRQSSSNYD